MDLRGQGGVRQERGYAMAALLVMIAVMAILMSVALPVWRQQAQREKEEELVFRGQQYVRAIRLYNNQVRALPPSVDVLVQGRYLRRKFKDPITGEDFEVIGAASPVQAQPGQPGQVGQIAQSASQGSVAVGGLMGVRSKSKDESIRIYQGRTHYNEWTFLFTQQQPVGPGGRGGPGVGGPGGRGGPGLPGGPGGRGRGDGRGGDGRGGDGRGGPGRGAFPGFPNIPGAGRGGRG